MTLEKNNLYFKCTHCGKCCCGEPGYVWLDEDEMEQIALFLQISKKEFIKKYVRQTHNRYSLIETKNNYSCIFLQDNKCRIYPVRPKQCKTFPWWPEYLKDLSAWESLRKRCPGTVELCDREAVSSLQSE